MSQQDNSAKPSVSVVLKGYPRLSETFIAQELLSLEQRGYRLNFVSLRHPTDSKTHPIHDEIQAPVNYLPEYLHQEPLRVLRAWWRFRRTPSYAKAKRLWLTHLKKEPGRNRIRRFGQALVMAAELPKDTGLIYAHFLHTPASVGWYAAVLQGLPWAVSAHAKDIWTSPEWELREKLTQLEWLVTCTEANAHYLKSLAAEPERVQLQYHGIDLSRFPRPEQAASSPADQPFTVISVGRAVPKKGYPTLLRALSRLPESLPWRFIHIGGGSQRDELIQLANTLGISEHIEWRGSLPQKAVLEAYREADLFVLASQITEDGDRDGMPNVLMEAQSQGLCCLATRISGIPELITDGDNGVLVEPSHPEQLAEALQRLAQDDRLRQSLGQNALAQLHQRFDHRYCMDQLVSLLEPTLAASSASVSAKP